MKDLFPGYFPISVDAEKALWDKGLFSLDANVLLDLYRYSDETRQELVKLLKSLGDRIWIPHQAAQEFLDGRLGVIASQSKLYDESLILIERVEKMFKSARGHPFLTAGLSKETDAHFKKLYAYLNGKKSHLDGLLSKDTIQDEVAGLLKGRIGAPFAQKRLAEIFADGEKRYKDKIPPGYEDEKKPEGISRFGDLVMWFQLMDKAQKEKKPITFMTADQKEDWWRLFQGRTIGPRPELVAEFTGKTGVEFQMLAPERFMKAAAEKLAQKVKPEAINEVKEVRKAGLSPGAAAILRAQVEAEARERALGRWPFPEYGHNPYADSLLPSALTEPLSADPATIAKFLSGAEMKRAADADLFAEYLQADEARRQKVREIEKALNEQPPPPKQPPEEKR